MLKKTEQKISAKKLKLAEKLEGKKIEITAEWLQKNDNLLYDNFKNDIEVITNNDDIIIIEFKKDITDYYIENKKGLYHIGHDIYQDYKLNILKMYYKKLKGEC